MRLVTYRDRADNVAIGALVDNDRSIVDLQLAHRQSHNSANPAFASMIDLMEGGEKALELARRLVDDTSDASGDAFIPVEDVTLLAPVPRPTQMRDFLCFEKHLRQAREVRYRRMASTADDPEAAFETYRAQGRMDPPQVWFDQPIFYTCNALAVIGTGQDVMWPAFSAKMDFELEFGVFVGKGGSDIAKGAARDHIFGYTIFNDISARDTQITEMTGQLGPGKGKDFDTANVLGPCIVTADEIGNPYDLTMTAKINGEEVSRGNSGEMHHDFEDIIAYISQSTTIYPGEFFGSGTVGSGCGLEYDRFLTPGDLMELEVERIGVLTNRLVRPGT